MWKEMLSLKKIYYRKYSRFKLLDGCPHVAFTVTVPSNLFVVPAGGKQDRKGSSDF